MSAGCSDHVAMKTVTPGDRKQLKVLKFILIMDTEGLYGCEMGNTIADELLLLACSSMMHEQALEI